MGARRVKGEGSIYQREGDGRWVGVVDLGRINGKRVRKTVTAPTLRELRPKFRALQAQIEGGVLADDVTVEGWLKHWMEHIAAKKLRPSTLYSYQRYIDKWIVPHLGKRRLDRLRPEHIRVLLAAMEDDGKADATRRQVYAILRKALAVAHAERKIPFNPAAHVDAPPVGQGSHGKFTLAEAHAILNHLTDENRARWVVALLAGLRQGEALGLQWTDLDFDNDVIVVERAAQRVKGQGVQLVPLKSRASYRAVPMVSPVRAALVLADRTGPFVFGGEKPRDARRDWQEWKDLLADAGVPSRPLHAARATTASLLSEAGVSDKVIAEILGHSQVRITQQHYIHGDLVVRQGAMSKLDALLAAPTVTPESNAPQRPVAH